MAHKSDDKSIKDTSHIDDARATNLIATMHSGILIYRAVDDGEDFVFVAFNRAFETLETISNKQIIGKHVTEVFPMAKESGLLKALQRVYKTGKTEHYPPSIYKSQTGGPDTWREAWLYKLSSEEVIAEYNDVTGQKDVERALRESKKQLHLMSDHMSDYIMMLDLDFKIQFINRAEAGLTIEQLIGTPLYTLVAKNDQSRVRGLLVKAAETGEPQIYNTEYAKPDGAIVYFESVVSPIKTGNKITNIVVNSRDITKRKHAEEKLKEYAENLERMVEDRTQELQDSEEWHRLLLENANDGILVRPLLSATEVGKYIEVNTTSCRMLGYTREELLQLTPRDITEPLAGNARSKRIETLFTDGAWIGEELLIAKDGTKIMVEASTHIFKIREVDYIFSVIRDISDRKALQEKLALSEKMATVGQLASGIAHELRNPLAIMTNIAYLLRMELGQDDPKMDRHLTSLEQQIFRSSNIINGLLDFAKTKLPKSVKMDIQSVIDETLDSLVIPENIEVITENDNNLPAVFADREQMLRVFSNLVNNSKDAIKGDGTITIQSSEQTDGHVSIKVSDTGRGISPENLEKIFEPMFTTKADMGGIGIGLAICKTIMDANKGTIVAKSKVGKGTAFIITLPIWKGSSSDDQESVDS